MKRKLDISQTFKTFEGKIIKEANDPKSPEFTLKRALLTYLRNCNNMGLDTSEQQTAFEAGFVIGAAEKETILTTNQYDVLKKLADFGAVKTPDGKDNDIFGPEIKFQMKNLVDRAEIIEEKEK